MFTVTKQWLDQHKTKSGAYTSGQLAVFGIVSWPPPKGWKSMVVGMQISDPQKHSFEVSAKIAEKISALSKCMKLIKKLNASDLDVLAESINKLKGV